MPLPLEERLFRKIERYPGIALSMLIFPNIARSEIHEALSNLEEAGRIERRVAHTATRDATIFYPASAAS